MPPFAPFSSMIRVALAVLAAFPACGPSTGSEPVVTLNDPPATTAATPLAIVGVRVIAMTANAVLDNQTVLVRDGVIVAIGSTPTVDVPAGSTVIDGAGRYVMPALIDMHVHLSSSQDLEQYVSSGIGTVRNMWGHGSITGWQRDIAAGTRVGPTIISASPGVDAPPAQWPGTLLVTDARQVRAIVKAQADAGWPYLKVYTRLTAEMFDSVMVAARDAGIPALGHVPLSVDIRHALESGMKSVEHFTGYDRAVSRTGRSGTFGWSDADPARYPPLVAATVSAGVWNCPTLAIYAELSKQHTSAEREAIITNRRAFVRALSQAGAKLLVGTDAGIDVVAPGTSIHDELREFVAAGLTPFDALRAATTSAADFLGRPDLGRVAAGARADLLLLEANPLSDIANAKRIDGVVLGGAWLPN
jgi:imidazolonepropionase-like amidohydrolase